MVTTMVDPQLQQSPNATADKPSQRLDSQTHPIYQKARHSTRKAVVSPLPSITDSMTQQRLALQVRSDCTLIATKGNQKIHQLPLKLVVANKAKGVAKYTYGTWQPHMQEYVVMVVGATGAGKSTLINAIANYLFKVDWNDDFRFKIIPDEGSGSEAHSKTQCITAYTIYKQEDSPFPHTLTIVDTPGFGDTTGLERDKQIVAQIRDFFGMSGQDGITHIHGIGFVTQASLARLTHTQRYVFDSILSVFGKDIGDNILLMTTFADGKKQPVLEAVKAAGIKFRKSFKFNNSAIFTDEASCASEGTEDSSCADEAEGGQSFDKMFWDMGIASLDGFFKQLLRMEPRSLQLTKQVLEEREQLQTIVVALQPQIQAILDKIDTLRQEERIMEQHEADIAANKNFKYKVKEPRIEKHDIDGQGWYVTNCTKCNFTCHNRCGIPRNEDKSGCIAMDANYCKMCPGKCHWTAHCNNSFWFEVQQVEVEKTYYDLKKRYEDALSSKSSIQDLVSVIRAEVAHRYHEVFKMTREAQQILQRLDKIALRPNPLSETDYIDLLIQSEQHQGTPGFKERIEHLQVIRGQAELLAKVKEKKMFENESLRLAQELALAEGTARISWFGSAIKVAKHKFKSAWSTMTSSQ